jgi:small subunit ribosomal protein S4
MYGITENQFKNYFEKASRLPGVTGENLLSLLERRLDNVVFRAGWADSRADARQMVLHGHFLVNGRKVDIPSYLVDEGDVVELSSRGEKHKKIKELMEEERTPTPAWLGVSEDGKATILREPQREDIDYAVEEQLIVEFYSK